MATGRGGIGPLGACRQAAAEGATNGSERASRGPVEAPKRAFWRQVAGILGLASLSPSGERAKVWLLDGKNAAAIGQASE